MSNDALFAQHSLEVQDRIARVLKETDFDGILFHAGTQGHYHADDRHIAFHTTPHFAWLAPLEGPGHLLAFQPGKKARLFRVVPKDFWYEEPAAPPVDLAAAYDYQEVATVAAALQTLKLDGKWAYVGNDPQVAAEAGLEPNIEPKELLHRLDWERAKKTPWEIESIREAGRIAGLGHAAVREGMKEGLSERALHMRYLEATGLLEDEAPYTGIIGWDENAAILHYQTKASEEPMGGHVLLIDAGATCNGYASDITRTWIRGECPTEFRALLDGMDKLQRELIAELRPGLPYPEIHDRAHQKIAALLSEVGILKVSGKEAHEKGLSLPFFPHGLGHHLGLQVHDVGGWQQNPMGTIAEPPKKYEFLRTTRVLEEDHVVTIEPGLYFIPMLLDPWRAKPEGALIDWELVDRLLPCGGIRIEDDVRITATGSEDLTRPNNPGHLD